MRDGKNVIPPNMSLFDRYGHEWRADEGYQENDATAPGWLLLTSGVESRTFSDVVECYGFEDEDRRYLRAVLNA